MENLKTFKYGETWISFQTGENIMVNATEMAKPYGKKPTQWLIPQRSKDFLNALSKARNLTLADLVVVRKGGNTAGTWMHEDAAIEFARWLNPIFAIWTNDRVQELLKIGMTALPDTLEKLANDPDLLIEVAQNLKDARERNNKLKSKVNKQSKQLKVALPKAQYHDEILSSNGLINITTIAKNLGMSGAELNVLLHEKGVQYKSGGHWTLYAKYQNEKYAFTKPHTIIWGDMDIIKHRLCWTPKGVKFINSLFPKKSMQCRPS